MRVIRYAGEVPEMFGLVDMVVNAIGPHSAEIAAVVLGPDLWQRWTAETKTSADANAMWFLVNRTAVMFMPGAEVGLMEAFGESFLSHDGLRRRAELTRAGLLAVGPQ